MIPWPRLWSSGWRTRALQDEDTAADDDLDALDCFNDFDADSDGKASEDDAAVPLC